MPVPFDPLISAAGFVSSLGGGPLPIEVADAMAEAAAGTWRPDDLQAWASTVIAEVTGAEAGWVTSGAVAGMTLAVAACIAGTARDAMDRLPQTEGLAADVLVQRGHRNAYDRAFRSAGARIVEVGFPFIEGVGLTYEWQLEAAFSERTAAVAHLALADSDGIALRRVCEIAASHGVPVIVDAAAELPPADNLHRYIDEGASLVAFSGGKAVRGPQSTGILAGRRDLIESVRLQTLDMDVDVEAWVAAGQGEPPHHGLGRGMKVGKEEIVGLVTALRLFVRRDLEAERQELRRWLEVVARCDPAHPTHIDEVAHYYPRLVVEVGRAARHVAEQLAAGPPTIVVPHAPLVRGEIVICAEAILPADRAVVVQALERCLQTVAAG
jgi:D-glucosaminate-6-phosphate ammonia-lyase